MNKSIRVLIADDHSIMRMGLAALINSEPDMTIVGEASNGKEAIQLARNLRPDVVIMDLVMPKIGGTEATHVLLSDPPSDVQPPRVLILTTFGASSEIAQAIRYGAAGALTKDTATGRLVSAIRQVMSGERVIPKSIERLISTESAEALSDRQLEILRLAARGFSNKDIAERLDISLPGVKKHFSTIFVRLGAANRAEAVCIAGQKHLLG